MTQLHQMDRRLLLGLGGALAVGATAQLFPTVANAAGGSKELMAALGGNKEVYRAAEKFAVRYRQDAKTRIEFRALAAPLLAKAQNAEDFSVEAERLGQFIAGGGASPPAGCIIFLFWLIIIGLGVLVALE